MSEQKTVRRGRPPKDPADRKGGNLTIRLRGSARDQVQEAAAQSGRSLSEEIEHRVGLSFTWEAVQNVMRAEPGQFGIQGGEANLSVGKKFEPSPTVAETTSGIAGVPPSDLRQAIADALRQVLRPDLLRQDEGE